MAQLRWVLPSLATVCLLAAVCQADDYYDDIFEETHDELCDVADTYYSEINDVYYTPPANRWQHMPNTMQTLRDGQKLRVVMLGDGIMHYTSESYWHCLVERHYPGSYISTRRSCIEHTGCWHFKNDVKGYVLDHKPDLVMIGGVSNVKDDCPPDKAIEHIKDVISQIRDGCDAEIMLMTGWAGTDYNPREFPESYITPRMDGTDYGSLLMQLAAAENCEFLDIRNIWGEYAKTVPYLAGMIKEEMYPIDNATQFAGRVLEAYFAPEPATLLILAGGLLVMLRRRT